MSPQKTTLLALTGVVLAASAYALVAPTTLTIDGRSAPADVRTIGGVPYVRLSDVGRALGMTVSAKGGGRYALTKAGGAGPLGGKAARIGDTLFNGRWRFSVLSVETAPTYTMRTNSDVYEAGETAERPDANRVVKAGRGYRLVVVRVRVTNGTSAPEGFWTAAEDPKVHNAIADTEGSSHRAIAYDYPDAPTITPQVLPGASLAFNVLFSLPTDAKPKDLVFTLPMTTTMQKPGTDVRVSLAGTK